MGSFLVLFFQILFFFPSTLMHELSHYTVAKICQHKISEFNPFPKKEGGVFYWGFVVSVPKINFTFFFVGLAPLLLLIPLYFIFKVSPYLDIVLTRQYLSVAVDKGLFLNTNGLVTGYFAWQLLRASVPSSVDIKGVLKAIFINPLGVNKFEKK